MRHKWIWTLLGGFAIAGAAACGQAEIPVTVVGAPTRALAAPDASATPAEREATPEPKPSASPDDPTLDSSMIPTPVLVPSPEATSADASVIPPDLMSAIGEDFEKQSGARRETAQLVRAEAVTWNDGSLGCPKPGELYTQALVDGYWVVFQLGEQVYDYRASAGGYFFRCEQSLPRPIHTAPPLVAPATPTP
jgi:hypothetical protein